jgi:colanic acid biosynthesis glycosyl transferase WcaI
MARFFADNGHSVRVITAPPYYPAWRVAEGYSGRSYRREEWQGMTIVRCPLWVPSHPGSARRLLHLASFALSSGPALATQATWRPQVIFSVAPALVAAPFALLVGRWAGSRSWLHLQDLEIDTALGLGMVPRYVRRPAELLESRLIRGHDRVSSISDAMVRRLVAKGAEAPRTRLLPNWVDTEAIRPLARPPALRASLGYGETDFVVLYSGNLGSKQGLEVLLEAAQQPSNEPMSFLIVGEGSARRSLEGEAGRLGLNKVRFLELQPAERLNELLNVADVHLVAERAGASDLVMPSKLGGIMASGRPFVVTAPPSSSLARAVADSGGGIRVDPGDRDGLAQALRRLFADSSMAGRLGAGGRSYAERHLAKKVILGRLLAELEDLVV